MLDKIKIGILDLLTILVPGGFLLFLLSDKLLDFAANTWKGYPILSSPWIMFGVFFALAYILGHFIFFLGSFLDDLIYEKVRKIYWHDHAKLTSYVLMVKEKKTGITQRKVLSAWKWACAWLMANQPVIYSDVERLMAESKFFRSLIIVCIAGIFVFPSDQITARMILGLAILIFLSLIRYLTQRQKSLTAAYHGILTTSNVILPAEPDAAIYTDMKKEQIYPNEKLFQIVKENDKKGKVLRPDKLAYDLLKFLYCIGLCLIPFFSSIVRSKGGAKRRAAKKKEIEQEAKIKKVHEMRNRVTKENRVQ